ncbi:MAG: hypothetical protein KDI50_08010 [Candidatus Competibacteraceae bacterium]|nr:hypothetical protein [Candidatus Competibacteraceae bacterium]
MKSHYDFSKGVRGQFYRPDAIFRLPIYLDEEIEHYLFDKAKAKGIDLSDLVNELLKREIEMIQAVVE